MKIKLAHQSTRTPSADDDAATKRYVLDNKGSGDILFAWNRTDTAEFILVDPMEQGWTLTYREASESIPPHMEIRAPETWENATGPVFVLTTPAQKDRDLVVTHDFIDPDDYDQILGNMDRYVSPVDYLMSAWDISGGETEQRSVVYELGVPSTLYTNSEVLPSLQDSIVRTHSTCSSGLVGCGWGRITGHGIYSGELEEMATARTCGFALHTLARSGTHGGETIRIFDFVVKRPSGGS